VIGAQCTNVNISCVHEIGLVLFKGLRYTERRNSGARKPLVPSSGALGLANRFILHCIACAPLLS
jgi:hypothetical protein